jgi:superfamily I DNA/RNA helicase
LTADDAILCRNTRPLVDLAYGLLKRGIPCRVEGKSIGDGLIALVTKWKVVNITAMIGKLVTWRDKEISKWMLKEREDKADEINDRAETILVLAQRLLEEGKSTVVELADFIKSIFGDTKAGEKPKVTTLCTMHRSKGREWRRVYLLGNSKYCPSKWAKKQWQIVQENNLQYVALTRCMFVRDRATGEITSEGELVDIVVEN